MARGHEAAGGRGRPPRGLPPLRGTTQGACILAAEIPRSPPLALRTREPLPIADLLRRELYFFSLYRIFEAALLALVLFSPFTALAGDPRLPVLARTVSFVYLFAALVLFQWARHGQGLRWQVLIGTGIDILAATLAIHALPEATSGIALMLLFNIGSAALLLPLRFGLGGALLAAAGLIFEYVWNAFDPSIPQRPFAEALMFSVSFFSIAMLTYMLGRQMRDSRALAERRGAELADLAAVNELIIRRMHAGVLLVDRDGRVQLANEAAQALLGDTGDRTFDLVAPEVARRLRVWRAEGKASDTPLRLGSEQVEVLPRFAGLLGNSDLALVFLDDASQVSRRAESLTLATLGRFSASLAHEIRNPLAAINYAAQLLEESPQIADGDRRLLQIVHQQCQRTNDIVESVLGIARRERATPEQLDLVAFCRRFAAEFHETMPEGTGHVSATGTELRLPGIFDSRHLYQVVTVLVQNALHHGRQPGQPAQVKVYPHHEGAHPVIDVIDRGPGIPEGISAQLFRPFYTTSEHGTGLGLYIARELCHANDARLDYIARGAGTGSCFRITLPAKNAMLRA
jgi:two-component system sensor histidine kinase PilS (NtrC family)